MLLKWVDVLLKISQAVVGVIVVVLSSVLSNDAGCSNPLLGYSNEPVNIVGLNDRLPMVFFLALSVVQIVVIVSGNENQIMASTIATLGLFFYLAYGSALLKNVVAYKVPTNRLTFEQDKVTYCLTMGKAQGAMSIICSFIYLLDTIWCYVGLCQQKK